MTTTAVLQSMVVVGGWGVDARMLKSVIAWWPGPLHYVSLGDELLSSHQTVQDLARALIAQYPEPSVWLGWSQGAQVVMAAARASQTPVEKVVTLAGFPRFVAGDSWFSGMAPDMFDAFRDGLAIDASRTWRRFQQLLIHGCPGEVAAQARTELNGWIRRGPAARVQNLERGLEWLAQEDQRLLWQQMDMPALHLLGASDALVQPWVKDLPVQNSSVVRVVGGMTHWPVGSKAVQCARLVNDFAGVAEETV